MSKATRAELAEAFLTARQYLGKTHIDTEDTREFICHCLELAEDRCKISAATCEAARRLVERRLCGCGVFTEWLNQHYLGTGGTNHDRFYNHGRKAQAARLAWLNSLITEFGGVA